jgi:hypothetical protein
MDEKTKKQVDSNWKEQVKKEKEQAKGKEQPYHEPNFQLFVSSLSMQAMIALGKLENPITKKTEKNQQQARYLIDTLEVIKNKTEGNLNDEESNLLEESLFNLRMAYIEDEKNDG